MSIRFTVNGASVEVGDVDPHVTLLEWLRASGLTGTKEGCAEGECGACAVAMLRASPQGEDNDVDKAGKDSPNAGACVQPFNSCLVPLPAVDGQSLVTVEGIARAGGRLHPVQQAMVDAGGSQCGYCTPGFVVSLFCAFYQPRGGYDPEVISGNLCRCTGYRPIAEVARALPPPAVDDPRLAELAKPAPGIGGVDHRGGGRRFVRPTSLVELLRVLADDPGATVLAGGTDLIVRANQRHERFATLVSIEAVPELRRFDTGPDEIVIGAGLTLSEVGERLRRGCAGEAALLEQLLPLFSSRLIRNRATLGGNLATASPIGDAAPALLALDARLTLVSAAGERRVPLEVFFTGYRRTALVPGEVIASVHLPRPLPSVQRFYKVSKRVLDDISTVAAAFALDLGPDGRTVERFRAAYGGIAATPLRALPIEAMAAGRPWTPEALPPMLEALAAFGTPMTDHRGTAAYRRAMMGKLLEKLVAETQAPESDTTLGAAAVAAPGAGAAT